MEQTLFVLLGGALGFATRFATEHIQAKREQKAYLRRRLIDAYLALMHTGRTLRYHARATSGLDSHIDSPIDDPADVWRTRADMSAAFYEIRVLGPPDVSGSAEALRRSVFDFVNAAHGGPVKDTPSVLSDSAHDAQAAFERAIRKQLQSEYQVRPRRE